MAGREEDKESDASNPVANIDRVGVFHFGRRNLGGPIEQLTHTIDQFPPTRLLNSLLVLPEAFNIDGEYGAQDHDRSMIGSLTELSRRTASHLWLA
jgi:hypothetical protein